MVIYHLGFSAQSYLASKVYPLARVIDCRPLTDSPAEVLGQLADERELLFHIDLSLQERVPLQRNEIVHTLVSAGIIVQSFAHTDQRKRTLQAISARLGFPSLTAIPEGDPDEALLVKTDVNVGGGPERRTLRRFPGLPVPALPSRITGPSEYYLARRREIPGEIWCDPTLHVEKHITNSRGLVVRSFWNQGRGVVSVIENPHEVIKKRNEKCPRWNYAEPVDELTTAVFRRMKTYAEHLSVSFFAADWVLDEQKNPYLVDLNLTPQWAVNPAAHTNNQVAELPISHIPTRLELPSGNSQHATRGLGLACAPGEPSSLLTSRSS